MDSILIGIPYFKYLSGLGITGPVRINEFGERIMDYSVYDLQKSGNSVHFVPILNFDSESKAIG